MSQPPEDTGQLPSTLTSSSMAEHDSTYPQKPSSGPSGNVSAVWIVLEENWPTAFKKVDRTDPAKVWSENLDGLLSSQMMMGLPALRKHEERFMPNAPACKQIISDGARAAKADRDSRPPDVNVNTNDPVWRWASVLWMSYNMRLVLGRKQNITQKHTDDAVVAARRITAGYASVWESESDKNDELFVSLMDDMAKALLHEWNDICKIGIKVETRQDLERIAFT